MKKQLIASAVAGILLFVWQFLSWAALGIHGNEMKYTDKQDTIMQVLSQQGLEDGNTYMLPMPAPGSTPEQQEAAMASNTGKPWATVTYHSSFSTDMGMSMARGLLIDLIAAWVLCWILLRFANLDFKTALLASLGVGLIAYLTIPYLNSIWFETNSIGYLADLVGQWGLAGAWLGWYLTKK